jgi:hypothetical protein
MEQKMKKSKNRDMFVFTPVQFADGAEKSARKMFKGINSGSPK